MGADQVLVGAQQHASSYNMRVLQSRTSRSVAGGRRQAGLPVNNRKKCLFKRPGLGGEFAARRIEIITMLLSAPTRSFWPQVTNLGAPALFRWRHRDIPWEHRTPYDYSITLCAHLAQIAGLAWTTGLFYESFAFQDSRARWLYTA